MTSWGIRSTVAAGLAALFLAPIPAAPHAWAATPELCDGKTATIVGTAGSDTLSGTDGDDVAWLGAGDDHFVGGAGDDLVCGGPGFDSIRGGAGDDRILGGADNDILIGELGDDHLDGGAGSDNIYGDRLGGPGGPGEDGADQVYGGPGDDRLSLEAGDGFGGGGADAADGGPGVDTASYEGSPMGVTIDVTNGVAHGAADDSLTGFEIYQGSYHSDTLLGSAGPDVLDGLLASGGRDRLVGRGGDDILRAYKGRIEAGRGNDVYEWSGGAWGLVVELGKGADRAEISDGTATIRGGSGPDTFRVVVPEELEDRVSTRLHGGPGRDRLSFAAFPYRVRVDVARGLATAHKVRSRFDGTEQVVGSAHADVLLGGSGRDRLSGRNGNDLLRGRGGGDLLIGGDGRDIADGGPGHDRCRAEVRTSCRSPR